MAAKTKPVTLQNMAFLLICFRNYDNLQKYKIYFIKGLFIPK